MLLLGDAGAGQRLVEQPVQLGPEALAKAGSVRVAAVESWMSTARMLR